MEVDSVLDWEVVEHLVLVVVMKSEVKVREFEGWVEAVDLARVMEKRLET